MPAGRPRTITDEQIGSVIQRMAEGELVSDICKSMKISESGFRQRSIEEKFARDLPRARESQAHAMAEYTIQRSRQALGLPGEGVQAVKLEIDTMKWYTTKIAPRIFGDKVDVTSGGEKLALTVVHRDEGK